MITANFNGANAKRNAGILIKIETLKSVKN
jgi:hypothetical protein